MPDMAVEEKAYQDRKKDLMKQVQSEPDSVRRAHLRRQANCREILEPLTFKDQREFLKRQDQIIDMLKTGEANAKYASEHAKRLAAEAAQRWADAAQARADQAKADAKAKQVKKPKGDDLRKIGGIGPSTATKLVAYGIDSFAKMAALDRPAQARLKQAIASPKADVADWVAQAAELA